MEIGTLKLNGNVFLAPMAGVTDKAFRLITKPFDPALMYTEMVSGAGLWYKSKKTAELLDASDEEQPLCAQIFGRDPDVLASIAVKTIEFNVKALDINMGCPAPKIVNNGDGSALMKNPELAGKIIKAVASAVDVPVSVKFRKGWDDSSVNAVELAKIAEENGAACVTVHGRTREQFYSGSADLDIIRDVKRAVSIPVIGNGDVTDEKAAEHMLKYTGCDGIMIGRAAQGNPWIFSRVNHYLKTGELLPKPTLEERAKTAKKHLELLVKYKGEHRGVLEARKHMAWYFKGFPGGAKLRERINSASTLEEMTAALPVV